MSNTLPSGWDPEFSSRSPMYAPLRPLAEVFSDYKLWPGLNDYQGLLVAQPEPVLTMSGKPLKVVAQDAKPQQFEQHYAPRVYMTGEIQTRTENWHDFFQLLTWLVFPRTKAVINAVHIPLARQRIASGVALGRRTPVENMLSLFDEGGAVVVSSDESLLQLIRDFKWNELFWQRRDELQSNLKCITFGHAMYEKGLAPYIGMTANCLLLKVDAEFLVKPQPEQLHELDGRMAQIFSNGTLLQKPKDLSPLPILGMPGWDPDNASPSYYDNSHYFRAGRSK